MFSLYLKEGRKLLIMLLMTALISALLFRALTLSTWDSV